MARPKKRIHVPPGLEVAKKPAAKKKVRNGGRLKVTLA